jgi:hypothetical protein
MIEMRNAMKILIGKPEGNRPLGSSRRRWKDNIKTECVGLDCTGRSLTSL